MKVLGFNITREQRASPENPATSLSDPANWLIDALGGGATQAGQRVNQQSAMAMTAVSACVEIISSTLGMLPTSVFEKQERGRRERTDHPAYGLISVAPNAEMIPMVFIETMTAHALTFGNGYAYIVRDGSARPVELIPLMPDRTKPERNRETGEITYVTRLNDGQAFRIGSMNMLHIMGPSEDGLVGYSPIIKHRETLGLSMAMQEYGARFFSNGASVKGVLEHPGTLTPEQQARLKSTWADAYAGAGNAHKTPVLEGGLKYNPTGAAPSDAQLLDSRTFQILEAARMYRMPPHKLAHLADATFSNIEQQGLEFVRDTMMPWIVRWEQEMRRKLLTEAEKRTLFFKFNVNALQRGDIKSRYEAYKVAREMGVLSANDIRAWEDLNPIEDGGDTYIIPLNMQQLKDTLPAPQPKRQGVASGVLRSAAERIARKEQKALTAAWRKCGEGGEIRATVEAFAARHAAHVADSMDLLEEVATGYTDDMVARFMGTHPDDIDDLLARWADEQADHIMDLKEA